MVRLFVALRPPGTVIAHLRAAASAPGAMVPGARLAPAEQVHLTLAFLGPVADPGPLSAQLQELLPGLPPVRLRLAQGGSFRGGALWLGVDGELEQLHRLQRQVAVAVHAVGLAPEARPWRPHVTVARVAPPAGGRQAGAAPTVPAALAGYRGPAAEWDRVELVHSRVTSAGARHEVVRHWPLG